MKAYGHVLCTLRGFLGVSTHELRFPVRLTPSHA